MSDYVLKTKAPTRLQKFVLRAMILIGIGSIANFVYWFARDPLIGNPYLYWLLVITLFYTGCRIFYEWYHYWNISVPKLRPLQKRFSVDILTTYFPGEPYEMIVNTLEAIQKITYPHTTYLCDEANDPYLIEICKKLGVNHVYREIKINAKAGNINNALQQATGDICLILDPDHIPQPNFLDPIIPHFEDDRMGFVQVVQAYYNIHESYVAKGAAQQTFQFYGPMMMTMNSYGTVNAIGANCTFRRKALDSIGGHAPGLAEDMHTAMQLHAKGWKSVYVPEVLATGLVPSTLTAYYKQQLKWSRGTLDLLTHVYPKLFKKFNWRQRIHYALLPLHYLIGIVYLINFLIPIIALVTSEMPWQGNVFFFGIITIPVTFSALLVRSYVQRWVMNEDERGFHTIGGLLQISAWWIFLLGLLYTIIGKKIPYLPTPKDGSDKTTWQILAPNIVVGSLSIFSIIYGLARDFTPFTLFMSGFALLNACFMFFTIYFGKHSHTDIKNVRGLKRVFSSSVLRSKQVFWGFRHQVYRLSRKFALPILLFAIISSTFAIQWMDTASWNTTIMVPQQEATQRYVGVFAPAKTNGLSSSKKIKKLQTNGNVHFDIVSMYLAWGEKSLKHFPESELKAIYANASIPMITWEPWASGFAFAKANDTLAREYKVLKHIASGTYDGYIKAFAEKLKAYQKPVFLRFAHEFDNPAYPWSSKGNNTASEFVAAWQHVHTIFETVDVPGITWVWNPWKPEAMSSYYPGEEFVDWIGLTTLNYSELNSDKKWYSFSELYTPFSKEIKKLPKHPVLLAEFGSLKIGGDQSQWIKNAFEHIEKDLEEIKGIVFFTSSVDKNWPPNAKQSGYIDWSVADFQQFSKASIFQEKRSFYQNPIPIVSTHPLEFIPNTKLTHTTYGVTYKKGQHWIKDNYTLTRKNLDQDFQKMKRLGISHIRFFGSDIYNYNVLEAAERNQISVAYSFWLPENIDFFNNESYLTTIRNKIVKEVRKYQDKASITSWHIDGRAYNRLSKQLEPPALIYEQKAYINFIQKLFVALQAIDTKRPFILDLALDPELPILSRQLKLANVPVDALGLVPTKSLPVETSKTILGKIPFDYLYTDATPDYIASTNDSSAKRSFYLANWQDQYESSLLSFDGLLDYEGNYKTAYREAATILHDKEKNKIALTEFPSLPAIRILKPNALTIPGKRLSYYAVFDTKDGWEYPKKDTKLKFQWLLIKNDPYGNPMALREIGTKNNVQITIPEQDATYAIQLKVRSGTHVVTTTTSLNTPLSINKKGIQY